MWFLLAGLALSGCASMVSVSSTKPAPPQPVETEQPLETPGQLPQAPPAQPSPRSLASLQLTDQGRLLLENGRLDEAIRVFERAVGLNPANGENYFYLAEAWLLKDNVFQAGEFNRLAEIYLKQEALWKARVDDQRKRIQRRSP